MTKKLNILLLCLFFSCSNINTIKTDVSNKNTTSTSSQLIMESKKNPLSNLDGLLKLKAEFKLNDKEYFNQSYFDDNNNSLVFFGKNVYYTNPKSETNKYDLGINDYSFAFLKPFLDEKGNGFAFYNKEVSDGLITDFYTLKIFDNFIPKNNLLIENKFPNLMKYFSPNRLNNIGVYTDNDIVYTYSIDKDNVSIINKIELSKKNNITNSIFNKNNIGFIFTKEESEDHKFTYKYYLYQNNKFDLLSEKKLDLKLGDKDAYIDGKVDENGNGYIYLVPNYANSNDDIELKTISNYTILDKSYLFEDLKIHEIKLDSKGNGFLISNKEFSSLFLYEMKDYKPTNNKYLLSDSMDKAVNMNYSINSNGDGFILISTSKNITIPVTFPITYDNEMIIINNYKIVK